MTRTVPAEPWRQLPSRVAEVIEPELPAIAGEILATIAAEVPEYARPLEGNFGKGLRTGVTEALRQFVELIREPDRGRGTGREVYVELGRGEHRQGRTLDSLQAAYRVGARVAWRRSAKACRTAGVGAETLALLAESMFAYIDELSADSVEGYAWAQSRQEGERQRRRRDLAGALLNEIPAPELRKLAAAAGWAPPLTVAPVACAEDLLGRLSRQLGDTTLAVVDEGLGCLILDDPDGPGRRAALTRAAADSRLAIGMTLDLSPGSFGLARAWQLTRSAFLAAEQAEATERPWARHIDVDEHLLELILAESEDLLDRLGHRCLAPLAALTPRAAERMRATALAYVQCGGNAVEMASMLHIHPQTARYRISRLRELFGQRLDQPRGRLELELALLGARR